jgi:hypothetical protein
MKILSTARSRRPDTLARSCSDPATAHPTG